MKNKVDMADICELADTLTQRECCDLDIKVDCSSFEECGDDGQDHEDGEMTHYTKEAQEIFDKYYDLITNTLRV